MRNVLMGWALIMFVSMPAFGQADAQGPAPAVGQADAQGPAAATRTLYLAQCAKCHGPDGVPMPIMKEARRFADPAWSPLVTTVQESIANGKGDKMPKFKSRLNADQILALAEYVLTLKNPGTN